MPPAVEPILEQVEAAACSALGVIVSGTDYWYTPSQAVRWAALTDQCLDTDRAKLGPIYILSHDRVDTTLGVGKVVDRFLFLDVAALFLLQSENEEGPFVATAAERYRIQIRMQSDIQKKLTGGDLTLGGLAYNTEILNWSMAAEETWLDAWALVFGRLRISFRTLRSTP